MAQTVGALFVEIAGKGFDKIREQLSSVRASMEKTQAATKALSETPATIPVQVQGGDKVQQQSNGYRAMIAATGAKMGETFRNATRGLSESFARLSAPLAELGTRLKGIGSTAGTAFVAAKASMLGFVALADPRGWMYFQFALVQVAIQLGRFFVPLVGEATGWIGRLAQWLKGLTDATRESVLAWGKKTLSILAVLTIVPRLIGMIGGLVGIFGTLRLAFMTLWAASPVGLFVLLVGALSAFKGADSIFGALMNAFKAIAEILRPVITLVVNVFSIMADMLSPVIAALNNMLPLLQAVATFFIVYKGVVLAGAVVTGILGTGMLSLTGIIAGLKTALMGLVANPIALGIAAIVTAVLALSGAFTTTRNSLDLLMKKTEDLKTLREKLEGGGKLTQQDLRKLPAELQQQLQETKGNPEKRKQVLEDTQRQAEADAKERLSEDKRIALQRSLEQARNVKSNLSGNRTNQQIEMVEQTLGRKFDDNEKEDVRAAFNKDKGKLLSDESIQNIIEYIDSKAKRGADTAEIVKALKEGRLEEGKKNSDKFRGEIIRPAAQLTSFTDYFTKLQTAGEETLQDKTLREQLEEQKKGNEALLKIKEAIENNKSQIPAPVLV